MPLSLIIDILVAVLLVVTIAYAIVLNKRLGMLRRDKTELEKLASSFGESTLRAEDSIGKLRSSAEALQGHIDRAQSLRDDLAFLIERGGKAADQLEDMVRDARKTAGPPNPVGGGKAMPQKAALDAQAAASKPAPPKAATPTVPEKEPLDARSEAERELLKALESAR